MIYKMSKPSENMLKSTSEIFQLMRESAEREYNDEQERIKKEENIHEMQMKESQERFTKYMHEQSLNVTNRNNYITNLKEAMLSECLMKLYTESSVTPLTSSDKIVAKNLVNKFIKENGVYGLISSFKTKNFLLSEFARIVNKYSTLNEKCEDCRPGEAREFTITPERKDDFFKELEDIDVEDASKLIKTRVSDAMSDFVDSNVSNKLDFEEVIQAAQDKIAKTDDEHIAEQYSSMAKRKINEMKMSREKNIFHCLVESLSTAAFKDETLKAKYINEASLDMESVVNDAQLVYTMLEMVNTTNMIEVNESFVNDYIKSLS